MSLSQSLFEVSKKRDGFLVVSAVTGHADFLDFWEGLRWRFTGQLPARFDRGWAYDGCEHTTRARPLGGP